MSQWAQQFRPQNSDFPFQPAEPKRLSQQDLGVGEGLALVDIKEAEPLSIGSIEFYFFLRVKGYKSTWLTEAS